ATKAAAEKAEGACREEVKRSKGFEEQLCNLQRERDELSGKLTDDRKASEEFKRRTEELENELRQRNEQLEHAKSELEKQAAVRASLESDLGGQLKAAKAAAGEAEASCREEGQRSKRFEGEWASLQQQREELSGKL